MCYKVLGHVPNGGELRRYETSQLDIEVGVGGSFVPSWVGHGFLSRLKNLSGTVVDYGCGSGVLGLHAAVLAKVKRVLFVDICDDALALSRDNVQRNTLGKGLYEKSVFLKPDDLAAKYQGCVNGVVANLPENPSLDFCGADGSQLQRRVLLESLPQLLRPDGKVLTKEISYAAPWSQEVAVQAAYDIEKIGEAFGTRPKNLGGGPAQAQYFCLTPKA